MYKRVQFVCTLKILARTSFLARCFLLVASEAEEPPQLPVSKKQTEAEEQKAEEAEAEAAAAVQRQKIRRSSRRRHRSFHCPNRRQESSYGLHRNTRLSQTLTTHPRMLGDTLHW